MDYEQFSVEEQRQLAKQAIKNLEQQHFSLALEIAGNRSVKGADLDGLRRRQSDCTSAIRELKRQFAELLTPAESPPDDPSEVEPATPERNGTAALVALVE
jgi:hypothetical protein